MTAPYIPPKRKKSLYDTLLEQSLAADATATPGYRMQSVPTVGIQKPTPRMSLLSALEQSAEGYGDTPQEFVNSLLNPIRQGRQAREMVNATMAAGRKASRTGAMGDAVKAAGLGLFTTASVIPGSPVDDIARASAYAKAPDSLMGFGRTVKGFDELRYPHTAVVRVTFPDGDDFVDAVNGMNGPHALERAKRNWDGAKIEVLRGGKGPEESAALLRWMDETYPMGNK